MNFLKVSFRDHFFPYPRWINNDEFETEMIHKILNVIDKNGLLDGYDDSDNNTKTYYYFDLQEVLAFPLMSNKINDNDFF
jgi:hypothetical protein